MRVALVHDWLVTYNGAERILEQLVKMYPDADIFSLVDFLPPERRAFIAGNLVAEARRPHGRRGKVLVVRHDA